MPTDVETLMEMGFDINRAQKALAKTGYKGVQQAMDWLFAHADDPDIDDAFDAPKGYTLAGSDTPTGSDTPGEAAKPGESTSEMKTDEAGAAAETGPVEEGGDSGEVKSLKCDDCGKVLKDIAAAEFHAAKTEHSNFSESTEEKKPLTAEEKEAQIQRLKELMTKKREEKDQQEKADKIAMEKKRREHGKEMLASKERLRETEMKKIVEQRKREKEEEKQARQRVMEQIEKDKRDRAAKFSKQSADSAPGAASAPAATPPAPVQAKKDYEHSRIQIRLLNGQALTQQFAVKESLAAIRLYVEMNGGGAEPFTFMTTFPRKVYTDEDMERPLQDLGLVPSAVLMVTKKQ